MKGFMELREKWKSESKRLGVPFDTRMRGRSTAIALEAIARAIWNPNTNVPLRDHHGTPAADRHLADLTMDLIEKMELEGFTYSRTHRAIKFNIDLGED